MDHDSVKEALFEAHRTRLENPARLAAFLSTLSPEVRAEVESLLAFTGDGPLEQPPSPLATAEPVEGFLRGALVADRYEIVELHDTGGMGEVYRARDRELDGTEIALKRLRYPTIQGEDRLRQEVKRARRVNHPAVCRVFDVGRADGELIMTMEFLEGEQLGRRLQRTGALPVEEVRRLAVQLLGGLAAAHELGIVHRDLKPANIVFDARGQPRITDFGIAASVAGHPDDSPWEPRATWPPRPAPRSSATRRDPISTPWG